MPPAISSSEAQELRRLIPLNTMPSQRFDALCSEIRIESAEKGAVLFNQGETRPELVYLLSGAVSLQAGGVELDKVAADSESARFSLAQQLPRKVSAVAKTPVRFVRIAADRIKEEPQPVRPPAKFEISGEAEPDEAECDWLSHLLRSPLFQRLPPSNLQALVRTVKEIRVPSGAVICRQDDPGDYYYIIKKGQCLLTRKPSRNAKEIKLAILKTCDTFGEDALISEQPRTVTVTMLTAGKLLRIEKADFLRLIRDPVIVQLSTDAAVKMINEGALWLDVRLPDAYNLGHARGSISAPFFSLRMTMSSLSRQKKYVLVCENSKISDAAAFLLIRHGFDAYVLRGGVDALPRDEWVIDAIGMPSESLLAEEAAAPSEKQPDPAAENPAPAPAQTVDVPETAAAPIPDEAEPVPAAEPALALSPEPEPETAASAAAEQNAGEHADKTPAKARSIAEQIGESELAIVELRQALARSEAEKKQALEEAQKMRLTADRLEAALQSIQDEYEHLLEERFASDRSVSGSAFPGQDEMRGLREQITTLTREKETSAVEAETLRRKVAELQEVLKGFLDREGGPAHVRGEMEALRSELQTVYRQADRDVSDMQKLILETESRNNSLQSELRTLRHQLSVREAADAAREAEAAAAAQIAGSIMGRWAWPAALGFLAAVLLAGVLLGVKPGRAWLQTWLADDPAPAAPPPALPPPPAPLQVPAESPPESPPDTPPEE